MFILLSNANLVTKLCLICIYMCVCVCFLNLLHDIILLTSTNTKRKLS